MAVPDDVPLELREERERQQREQGGERRSQEGPGQGRSNAPRQMKPKGKAGPTKRKKSGPPMAVGEGKSLGATDWYD